RDRAPPLPSAPRLRSAKGAYKTLQEFLRLCDAGGPNCAFSQGNPQRRFDRLAKRLLRQPSEFTHPISGETFVVTYAGPIGGPPGVPYGPARGGGGGRGPPGAGRADQAGGGRGRPAVPAGPARGGVPAGGLPQLRRGLPRSRLLRDP